MQKVRVLFMGTTLFSQQILKTLLTNMKDKITVVGLVCQPDRKIGRKQDISFLPIKNLALTEKIPLFQPEKIITIFKELEELAIDVIITCAYGQFLPPIILNLPKNKCLNIHASLLPALRGGAPIQWAIINGLQKTGITIMKMVRAMDAGPIYTQKAITISEVDTYTSLTNKLIVLAQDMLKTDLLKIINNEIDEVAQDETQKTYGLNLQRKDEKINWNRSAQLISCQIRGLYNSPIAYTTINGKIYKIHEVVISDELSLLPPGTIVAINKLGIIVATTSQNLIIKTIQQEGKKPISARFYFGSNSAPIKVGLSFT